MVASRRMAFPAAGRALAFGLAWWVSAAAPFLFFHDRLFMRYSYFAHAGLSIAVASAAVVGLAGDPRPGRSAGPTRR